MEWWIFSVRRPHVIAISQMVASDIIRFFSFPEDRIHLVPNGVDTRKYHPGNRKYREEVRQRYGIGPEEYVFLFVAQNPRLKGYPLLVEACSALAPKPFRVLVVGPYTVRMKKAVEGLGDRMIFAGRSDDLYKIYPACECLVHPTYYDSFSLVILEALASGTPVITTHAAGAKMFITKENGMVIPPGDKDALVRAMNYFYSLRGRMKLGPFEMRDQESTFHEVEDLLERYQERDS